MPMADNLASTSLVLSIAIAAIAVILGVRQWFERQVREIELSEADRNHFSRQDLRRWLGVLLLLILAIGVLVGSRIEPVTVPWEVLYGVLAGGGVLVDSGIEFPDYWRVNVQFVQVWLIVNVLIFVLLALALFDWRATRRYAQRHRQSMARERIEILRKTLEQSDPRRNGHPREPDQDHR